MTDTIDIYPQSSCPCYEGRPKNSFPKDNKGVPTNLSVRRQPLNQPPIPEYFDFYNTRKFKQTQEPHPRTGGYWFNPQAYKEAPGFKAFNAPCKPCNNTVYTAYDPRLLNSATGDIITLDRPPTESTVRLADVYNENLRGYGKNYKDYRDINAGQITYYIDKSIEDPYFSPLFQISSYVEGEVYQDPMNSMKPAYYRQPLVSSDPLKNNMRNFSKLTSINDSTSFRENLMGGTSNAGGLMATMNRQKYSARWTNNID